MELQEVEKKRGLEAEAGVAGDSEAGETRARRGTGAAFTTTEAALKVSEAAFDAVPHFASSAPRRDLS